MGAQSKERKGSNFAIWQPCSHSHHKQEDSSPAEEYSACRTTLPVAQPEKSELNLWSFLKQCIGKELTKITMPVQVGRIHKKAVAKLLLLLLGGQF